ncbi:TolB-like translocation protein [Pontimicrobium aquaticum]|uniref:WD40-like Beta Propeller Repeat n=1 Tax=Pontimicrobium aquaticum TaxID=2565367 RepID=A0A4U0F0N9_9FLAO|nr:PD40 domain-containing protein [Pontimicrobium aquaticum]TJY37923.1 hypothetical protein E5167_01315 [Pontimicrobium aquaticum]
MKYLHTILFFIGFFLCITNSYSQSKPTILGKGIISRGAMEFNATLTKNNDVLFFTIGNPMWSSLAICYSEKEAGEWNKPKLLPFSGKYLDADPFLFNENQLFFISDRPTESNLEYKKWDYNIWYSTLINNEWSKPIYLEGSFNDLGMLLYPSLSKNKNLYFTAKGENKNALYVSKWNEKESEYSAPKKLSFINDDINYLDAVVSKDESFIIFTANMEGGFGGNDLWISFKEEDIWGQPINLGAKINSSGNDGQPGLSPDGKVLYYSYGGSLNSQPLVYDTYKDLYRSLTSAQNGFLDIYHIEINIERYKALKNNTKS